MTGVATTTLPLSVLRRGKVRDVYEVDDRLLVVATDRVSAFDVVMRETVPYKGAVLTQLTAWWLRQLEADVPHHMISADADAIVREVPSLDTYRDLLRGRAMLVWRADVFPVECVIRGYIAGSAWKEYRAHGTLAGEPLATGLGRAGWTAHLQSGDEGDRPRREHHDRANGRDRGPTGNRRARATDTHGL
jgi:phosphoribosylaminoimidazole-succinocarboxamide synthase